MNDNQIAASSMSAPGSWLTEAALQEMEDLSEIAVRAVSTPESLKPSEVQDIGWCLLLLANIVKMRVAGDASRETPAA